MKKSVQSIIQNGSAGTIVEIECQLSNGLPMIVIVGLGNKAVDEAKERIRSAFVSAELELPRKRIIINLAPADVPKESTCLDLAIAAAIMLASKQALICNDDRQAFIGEIGLGGDVRPVRGIIGKLLAGKKAGLRTFIIPADNLKQAQLIPELTLIAIASIKDLLPGGRQDGETLVKVRTGVTHNVARSSSSMHNLSHIVSQEQAKRALEIAAAGGHNLLLSGPPGTGKSMLARALPSLLPPMSHQEVLEVTHLHSLANDKCDELVAERPFRAPHHNASHVSIIGGGSRSKPGEITLSHRGVLFMDEMPEFNRQTLEALRQPLEDKSVTIARAKQSVHYPADFILVATANPCPCGYYGTNKSCCCTPQQILRYRQKLSGPILDRIDLHVTVDAVNHAQLLNENKSDPLDQKVQKRVKDARTMQQSRFHSSEKVNAAMTNIDLKAKSLLTPAGRTLLDSAAERLTLSARSYMRTLKIARTIADLDQQNQIQTAHISEALQYRPMVLTDLI